MNKERRDELRKLCEAATPGPWLRREELRSVGPLSDMAIASLGSNATRPDLRFVSEARSAIPELLDALEAAEVERDRLLVVLEIASGIIGMDSDDAITGVKVHFDDGRTMYIQDALAQAIEAVKR